MHPITASITIPRDFAYAPFPGPESEAQTQILEFLDEIAVRVGLDAYLRMVQQSIAAYGDGWRNNMDYIDARNRREQSKFEAQIEGTAKAIESIADMMDNMIRAIPKDAV